MVNQIGNGFASNNHNTKENQTERERTDKISKRNIDKKERLILYLASELNDFSFRGAIIHVVPYLLFGIS